MFNENNIKSITLVARLWFDKVNGNTYHTVEIIVNGIFFGKTDRTYGYGRQFSVTAASWMLDNEFLTGPTEPMSEICRKRGIKYYETTVEVSRKKDL
jgi:hypothetical protein